MKIHFVGIGGIGVSALAKYYLAKGYQVSGSDLVSSKITDALRKKGAKISIGKHKAANVPQNAGMVIYSPAVPKDNPELKKSKVISHKSKVKIISYPQALGELTKKYFTIAVCGTHGKSTTTAMIGLILTKAGLNPTIIVGTKLKEFGDSNFRMGSQKSIVKGQKSFFVIEADEHLASFLNYWPKMIVLTSLEPDHLDYYGNFKNYTLAFKKFIARLPGNGILVVNQDDFNVVKILRNKRRKAKITYTTFSAIAENVVYYSLQNKESAKVKKILKIPGEHNISNALAALKVAKVLKINDKISFKALSQYRGAWRRFEEKTLKIKNLKSKIILINDYAHHPTEVRVTLKAAREKYPKRKIWLVFQPHQYQRTYYLFKDFVKVFREALTKKIAWAHSPRRRTSSLRGKHFTKPKDEGAFFACDKLIITDIYDVAGREKGEIKKKVSSKKLVEAINKSNQRRVLVNYVSTVREAMRYLRKNLKGGEVVIIMGAGDIYDLSTKLTELDKSVKRNKIKKG